MVKNRKSRKREMNGPRRHILEKIYMDCKNSTAMLRSVGIFACSLSFVHVTPGNTAIQFPKKQSNFGPRQKVFRRQIEKLGSEDVERQSANPHKFFHFRVNINNDRMGAKTPVGTSNWLWLHRLKKQPPKACHSLERAMLGRQNSADIRRSGCQK